MVVKYVCLYERSVTRSQSTSTHVKEFCIFPDLTLLDVVLLRVLEALLEVRPNLLEERILSTLKSFLDVIEGYGPLDLVIVVGVLPFGRQTQEIVGQLPTAPARETTMSARCERV